MELVINDRIRNRKIEFFESFDITLRYDALASTFSFGFKFDPNNQEQKDLACIGHYHIASLYHNGELLLTGYILSESLTDDPTTQPVTISGYSLPGFLEDCQVPVDYALQFNKLTLAQISEKLIEPFGLKQIIHSSVAADMNKEYTETEAKVGQTVRDILVELATQRNIIISHDQYGRLVYTRPSAKQTPIFNFEKNIPQTSMNLNFDGQGMHSHITVVQQKDFDPEIPADESEPIRNPYVPFVYRPHVVTQTSGNASDTQKAAENIRARELKGMTLNITTDRWIIDGKVIRPGKLLTALNPSVYLYKKSTWFIESVRLKGDSKQTVATIGCVLPEVYSGEAPSYLFKGINLH